jgi:prolipoprotein diacylglyceryltransferase
VILPLELQFACQLGAGMLLGLWFIQWTRWQHPGSQYWLEAALITLLAAIIGARAFFITLHLDDFLHDPSYIPALWYGELSWQGALIGGAVGMVLACRLLNIPLLAFADGIALALPCGFMAAWWAARTIGSAYGPQVSEPDAYPVWQVGYVRALFSSPEARYELQLLGVALGLIILAIMGWVTLRGWLVGRRLGLSCMFIGAAMLPLEYWRADADPPTVGLFSAALLIIFGILIMVRRSSEHRLSVASVPVTHPL